MHQEFRDSSVKHLPVFKFLDGSGSEQRFEIQHIKGTNHARIKSNMCQLAIRGEIGKTDELIH